MVSTCMKLRAKNLHATHVDGHIVNAEQSLNTPTLTPFHKYLGFVHDYQFKRKEVRYSIK
jgi:hypothetical protein